MIHLEIDVTDAKGCVKQSAVFICQMDFYMIWLRLEKLMIFVWKRPTNLGGGSIELQTSAGLAFTGGSGLFIY